MSNDDNFFGVPDEIPDRPDRTRPQPLHRDAAEPWLVEKPKRQRVDSAKVKFGVKTLVRIVMPFIILAGVGGLFYYLYNIFSGAYGG